MVLFRLFLLFASATFWCVDVPLARETTYQWVQLAPDNKIAVRLITSSPKCPSLNVDGRSVDMTRRVGPSEDFPEHVCELLLPQTTGNITLDGRPLPPLPAQVQRIAVIGDTGCRIRRAIAQSCNDPDAWPLRKIMAAVAAQKPDLVIHVGDYVYRSMPCPPPADCEGTSYGDRFQTWVEDWIDPAQQALSGAPVVFVRGNHENCGRGGKGWFRYFANGAFPAECPALTEPWKASVGGLDLIVFDASDGRAPESARAHFRKYRNMAEAMFARLSQQTWFLTHRPLWVDLVAFGNPIDGDDTQREAFAAMIPDEIKLIASGHIHAFQAIDLENGPVQVISGNSGTWLDPMPNGRLENIEIAGSRARTVINDHGFGFVLMSRQEGGGWQMDAMDENGKPRRRCRLQDRALDCDTQAR